MGATATALAGVATTASSLSPNAPLRERVLSAFEPDSAQIVAHALGVGGGLVLIWLALGVQQGRRSASHAAVALLGVLALVHLAKGLDYDEALLGIAVALALHRGERHPTRALFGAMCLLVTLAAAYATTLTIMLISGGQTHVGAALLRAGEAVGGVTVHLNGTELGVLHFGLAIAAGALFALLRALLAPAHPSDGHDAAAHVRAATLVARHGEDSIAPFALRADKAFHFAHGGVVAYRTLRETAVVAGDPIGPPERAVATMASFLTFAYDRGWDVVLLGAKDENAYAELGLRSMQVGLEAVVDPRSFTLDGRSMKTVRKAVHRVRRHGWTVEVISGGQLDGDTSRELLTCEQAWRRSHRRLYGFAMAGDRLWGAPEDGDDVYAIARNEHGEVRAFQRYVRYRRGYSLDAMRRLDDEPNGIADSLVAALLAHAREQGASEVSLNFSGFGHLMAADSLERRSHRLARWALRRMHGRFQLERLMRFAEKFRPSWRPRYLVYTTRTRLPLAALRVMQAEAYIKPPPAQPAKDAWLPAPVPVAGS